MRCNLRADHVISGWRVTSGYDGVLLRVIGAFQSALCSKWVNVGQNP